MKKRNFIFFSLVGCQALFSALHYTDDLPEKEWFEDLDTTRKIHRKAKEEYPYDPFVPLEIWNELKQYFLPTHHPIKGKLDKIFATRVTLNREAFIEGGFEVNGPRGPGNLTVGKHRLLKGYVIKAFMDTQDPCDWENFYRRVVGALSIRKCIRKHGYQNHFKVPRKWIYPLPQTDLILNEPEYHRKSFVIIATDMEILSNRDNAHYFKKKITPQILDELFVIITEEGLIDSIYPFNIPFNKKGQMNFVDTEHFHHWPVKYEVMLRYLNPEMRVYWEGLIQKGIPPNAPP